MDFALEMQSMLAKTDRKTSIAQYDAEASATVAEEQENFKWRQAESSCVRLLALQLSITPTRGYRCILSACAEASTA